MSKKPFQLKKFLEKKKAQKSIADLVTPSNINIPDNKVIDTPLKNVQKDAKKVQTIPTPPLITQTQKDSRKKSDKNKFIVDMDNIKKHAVFIKFIDWISLPDSDRSPKTQKEFAKFHKVSEDTLSLWKNRKGFWDEVRKNVKSKWRGELGRAVQALFMGLIENRNAKEFLAFVQYIDDFNPKVRVSDETPLERRITPEQRKEMLDALTKTGLENSIIANKQDDDEN